MTAVLEIPGFAGRLITPESDEYDASRSVWNAMHDKRPVAIARAESYEDVRAVVRFAHESGLPLAIRGGGHSIPGFGVVDDGIVLDMRAIADIEVDPDARRVVIGAGALLGEVDEATAPFGLVVPAGVVSHTGVAGLTLGGGVGRLMRRFGLSIDSLLSVQIITADGELLVASATEHPDLFWALRGGGGNFGVVVSFEFRLHELSHILQLTTFNDSASAGSALRHLRDTAAAGMPSELHFAVFIGRGHHRAWMPDEHVGALGMRTLIEWTGEEREGRAILEAIRDRIQPTASSLDLRPHREVQTDDDELFHHGVSSYQKASFVDVMTDDMIDAALDRGSLVGSHLTQLELITMGGAIATVDVSATAFPHRTAAWIINVLGAWEDPSDTEAELVWSRETFDSLYPFTAGGAYVNFMEDDETSSEQTAYGPTLERLQAVKSRYDPDNLFRINQNILPVPVA